MLSPRFCAWIVSVALIAAAGCGGGSSSSGGGGGGAAPPPPGGGTGGADLPYPGNGHSLGITTTSAAFEAVEDELFTLCNNHRVGMGLNALIDDLAERSTARAHSKHMIEHDFFAHTNPEGDGPGARMTANGVPWNAAGENIAAGYATATDAFNGWLASPGHKANIENTIWTHTGTGYWFDAADDDAQVFLRYYTQVFSRQ